MKKETKFKREILDQNNHSIKRKKKNHTGSSILTVILTGYILVMICIATFTLFHPHMRNDLQRYMKKEVEEIRDDKSDN